MKIFRKKLFCKSRNNEQNENDSTISINDKCDALFEGTGPKEKLIAMNSFSIGGVSYIQSIQSILSGRYNVVPYEYIKRKIVSLEHVAMIYLNWIENSLSDEDKQVLEEAHALGVKIVWVFHNKIAHDKSNIKAEIAKIRYMYSISDIVLILSFASKVVLKQYIKNLDEEKIKILPHTNYVGNYGNLSCQSFDFSEESDLFTFAFAGAVRPYKNIELLIEAFNKFSYKERCRLLIAGKALNQEYADKLMSMSQSDNICFVPGTVPSSMMEKYIQYSDVVVLPYDSKSSMNSGVMMMAFSCGRTVISPKIEMTCDFDDSLMYCYNYNTREEHIRRLVEMMGKAYTDGRNNAREKGAQLYQYVRDNYSRNKVRKMLVSIIDPLIPQGELPQYVKNDLILIRERNQWKENARMCECVMRIAQNNMSISGILKYSGVNNVAIWGTNSFAKQLYTELKDNGINVSFMVAASKTNDDFEVPVYYSRDELPFVEFVIVTVSDANMYWLFNKFHTEEANTRVVTLKELF